MQEDNRQSELRHRLWNDAPDKIGPGGATTYESAVLEQYRLYVEMADRVSARRGLANSFFLTLNTGIFSLIVAFGITPPEGKTWGLAIPLAAILGQCFAWFYLVRSYRLLNSAKYQVVGALEERLPASPFWRAEWWALGEGKTKHGIGPSHTSSSGSPLSSLSRTSRRSSQRFLPEFSHLHAAPVPTV